MLHQIPPLLAHEDDRPLHLTLLDGEKLGATQTDPLHGLQISGDPFLGNIPADPMPPSLRMRHGRRLSEFGFKGVFGARHTG